MDNATKIQAVINTLETLEMPAKYSNMDKMIGIYKTLTEVRDSLVSPEGPKEEAEDEE